MTRLLLVALLGLGSLAASCTPPSEAEILIDRAIEAHGMDELRHAVLSFDFRGKHLELMRDGGRFRFERTYSDSSGSYLEVFSNDSLYRMRNGEMVTLTERDARILHEAIHALQYLATLPLSLQDDAVQPRYLGESEIEGEPYDEVEVTFRQERGGRDWQDRYVYWFHRETHTMDYHAYDYETGDGGSRFRKAINPRRPGGVLLHDFLNMTADPHIEDIARYDEFVGSDSLRLVSLVEHENLSVEPLP